MEQAGSFDHCCSNQLVMSPSLLVSGFTVDILSTFCGVFVVQCAKLMLRDFEFGVLLFDFLFVAKMSETIYHVWALHGKQS